MTAGLQEGEGEGRETRGGVGGGCWHSAGGKPGGWSTAAAAAVGWEELESGVPEVEQTARGWERVGGQGTKSTLTRRLPREWEAGEPPSRSWGVRSRSVRKVEGGGALRQEDRHKTSASERSRNRSQAPCLSPITGCHSQEPHRGTGTSA